MSEMMTAVAVDQFRAEPRVQKLPVPPVGPGEIRVRLRAASMNPADWHLMDGIAKDAYPHVFPMVPGYDGAGVVDTIGPGTKRFRPGDNVFGLFWSVPLGRGTYAEYVVVPESDGLLKIPPGLDMIDSAAVPTAGMTAIYTLDTLRLRPGDTLLVHGASGGVGSYVIPLAGLGGVRTIGTARPEASAYVRSLGAEAVFDSRRTDLCESIRQSYPEGADGLIDLVSQTAEGFSLAASVVRPGGFALSANGVMDPKIHNGAGLRWASTQLEPTDEMLSRLAAAVLGKKLNIPVTSRIRLDQAPEAIRRRRQGGVLGKTVLLI